MASLAHFCFTQASSRLNQKRGSCTLTVDQALRRCSILERCARLHGSHFGRWRPCACISWWLCPTSTPGKDPLGTLRLRLCCERLTLCITAGRSKLVVFYIPSHDMCNSRSGDLVVS